MLSASLPGWAMAELEPQSIEELEAAAEDFEALVVAGLTAVIAEVLVAQGIEDLSAITPSVVDMIVNLWNAYVDERLVPFLSVSMLNAIEETTRALVGAVGEHPFLSEPLDTQVYLMNARNRLVGIGNELWFNARTAIAEGLAAGESIPKIATRVRDAAGVTEPRARVIARTESHGARNTVNAATVRRAAGAFGNPSAFTRRWQAAEDARTRPTHVEADGQTVALNEPFTVGLASLDFPGDPAGPPGEVIACRCTTITLIDVDALNLSASTDTLTLNAAAYQIEESEMPWSIVEGDERCDAGEFAVVKDEDNELEGCHATREDAQAQLAALNAAESEDADTAANPAAMGGRNTVPWSGVLVVEGVPTGDGRQFASGSLTWPEVGETVSLELPLGWMYERAHGGMSTDKVALVGRIDTITRKGNELHGTGLIDLDSHWGREAARLMGTREDPGFLAGVSIDADDPEDPRGLNIEYVFPDSCALEEMPDDEPLPGEEMALECMMPEMEIYHSGRIRAATLVDIPAYVEARLYLDEPVPEAPAIEAEAVDMPLMASSFTMTIPDLPPVAWFEEPRDEPEIGAITITVDGRMFGYLAPAQVAHRGIRDKRVTVPMGNVDYGIWMNRVTLADDGSGSYTRVATGPITMDCGHAAASPRVVGAARREHYDNSCSIVATVRVGENSRGVWIAGAVLPDVTPDQIRRMMACQLSGDWGPHREKPGKRELAGALLVPVPGFPKRSNGFMSMKAGQLDHVAVPVRFGRVVESQSTSFGTDAAAERIAASIGRDRVSRLREFAALRRSQH